MDTTVACEVVVEVLQPEHLGRLFEQAPMGRDARLATCVQSAVGQERGM
jgi:hypothetical protein